MNVKRIRLIQRIIIFLLITISLLYICCQLYYRTSEGFDCTKTQVNGVDTRLCATMTEAESVFADATILSNTNICYNTTKDSNLPNQYVCYDRPGPLIYDSNSDSHRPYDNLGDNDISPSIEAQSAYNNCSAYVAGFGSFSNAYRNTLNFESSIAHIDISSVTSIIYYLSTTSTLYCPTTGASPKICNTLRTGITDFETMRDNPTGLSLISTNVGQSVSTMRTLLYHNLLPMFIDSGCMGNSDLQALQRATF